MENLMTLPFDIGLNSRGLFVLMLMASVGFILMAAYSALNGRDLLLDRMRATAASYGGAAPGTGLKKSRDMTPQGMLKALIPEDRQERTQIRGQLQRAGFDGPNVVRNFFVLRLMLAVFAPLAAGVLLSIHELIGLPLIIDNLVGGMSPLKITQVVAVTSAVGFYGPTMWLRRKIKNRQMLIEQGFPNALDLLQIATESGMGFDTAMTRVAQALMHVTPAIAEEFVACQNEILAGRDRQVALNEMSDRMGVDEVNAFVQLIGQSMEYGTSISTALTAYAVEMREAREMKAVEKANKLPVQMSGVMASMMLPALFLITLGPTVIRYLQVFGD